VPHDSNLSATSFAGELPHRVPGSLDTRAWRTQRQILKIPITCIVGAKFLAGGAAATIARSMNGGPDQPPTANGISRRTYMQTRGLARFRN
jgi:hypothetical protein